MSVLYYIVVQIHFYTHFSVSKCCPVIIVIVVSHLLQNIHNNIWAYNKLLNGPLPNFWALKYKPKLAAILTLQLKLLSNFGLSLS